MGNVLRGAGLVLLLVAAAACNDASAPRPIRQVRVPLALRDSAGQPVERGYIVWRLYFPVPSDTVQPFVWGELWTDSAGRAVVSTDAIGLAQVDSLVLSYSGPGCIYSLQHQATAAVAALGDTGFTVVVDSLLPAARLQPGELCATGENGPDAQSPVGDYFWIGARIDSITGPVFHGRWVSAFQSTRGGYGGSVLGAVVGDAVTLTFTNDQWPGPCQDFQLQGFLRPDGSWEGLVPPARNDCFTFVRPLDFVATDYPGLIP